MNKKGFAGFVVLYLLPYASGVDVGNRMGPVLLLLLQDALTNSAFAISILGVLLTHVLALALCWPLYCAVLAQLRGRIVQRPAMAAVSASVLLWVALYGLNQIFFHETRHQLIAQPVVFPLAVGAAALVLISVVAHLWQRRHVVPLRASPRKSALVATVVASCALLGFGFNRSVEASIEPSSSQRNIIIIGIDSLSQPVLETHPEAMPQFQHLYRQSVAHTNAWSPMGRTCPTWLSILSGTSPASHGGVFNLRHSDRIDRSGMLPIDLQQRGYGTVFGLDERRFCSIDESFGFDVVVGPAHGAMDFMVQKFNDSPLVNVFLQLGVSDWLLPHSRLNVAAHATYPAMDFVEAVREAVGSQKKNLFLAVHLESAHYPYVARDAREVLQSENRFRSQHVNALTVVDDQIGFLMRALRSQGRLDDALVVFVSDHGESFGDVRKIHKVGEPVLDAKIYGHGTSVLMAEQNHVVLAYLQYRQGEVVNRPAVVGHMVSLLDLKSVLTKFATDGVPEPLPGRTCVTLETGIRMAALADYTKMDEATAAETGAGYYEIDALARVHLREDKVADLIGMKDVAARCGDIVTQFDAEDQRLRSFREASAELFEVPVDALGAQQVNAYREELGRVAERARQLARSQ